MDERPFARASASAIADVIGELMADLDRYREVVERIADKVAEEDRPDLSYGNDRAHFMSDNDRVYVMRLRAALAAIGADARSLLAQSAQARDNEEKI